MVAVRYAALAALVIWMGGMLSLLAGDAFSRLSVALACGLLVLLSLFVMKFVGPPPRAFLPRVVLVALMLIATTLGAAARLPTRSAAAFDVVCGAILLFWYVRE